MVNDVQQCANLGTTMYSDISNKHIRIRIRIRIRSSLLR